MKIFCNSDEFSAAHVEASEHGRSVDLFDANDILYVEREPLDDDGLPMRLKPSVRLLRFLSTRTADSAEDYFSPPGWRARRRCVLRVARTSR